MARSYLSDCRAEHEHHQHGTALCVEPGGRFPTLRGYDTHAAERESTGTLERRGQTSSETLTFSFFVCSRTICFMCDDDSVLAQVGRNTSLHFQYLLYASFSHTLCSSYVHDQRVHSRCPSPSAWLLCKSVRNCTTMESSRQRMGFRTH